MATVRQQKIAAQIRRLVSEVLIREVGDPRVDGLVTVTKVELTPDLHDAVVSVSVLGGTHTPQTVLAGLNAAARRIQDVVAKGLPIRLAPHLRFALDESIKKEAEILRTIDAVARADQEDASRRAARGAGEAAETPETQQPAGKKSKGKK